jgi:DNA-directed RNA polymerase subunit RPC12/RpoP
MPIVFHCESCKKKIQAPDGSGGKYANCPTCKHKVYIPMPKSAIDDEELKLAPIDDEEEKRRQAMMRETYSLQKTLLKQKEVPEGADLAQAAGMDDKEVLKEIIIYLRQMVDGQIDSAKATAQRVAQNKKKAIVLMDRLSMSDMPEPELQDVPPQVLSKLIRQLRNQMQ